MAPWGTMTKNPLTPATGALGAVGLSPAQAAGFVVGLQK